MSKASILIVEDEALVADDIARMLTQEGYTVFGIADNAEDVLKILDKKVPDVILLDINIKGDQDGIELSSALKVPFIYLTSYYDQHTIERASKTKPAGYVLKPFSNKDLMVNIELALKKTSEVKVVHAESVKIFVRKDQELISISSDDILYAEAFDNYSYVYTSDQKYMVSHTLKSIQEKLEPFGFVRVHRSFLVNYEAIEAISEGFVLLNGCKVLIGRSYRRSLMNILSLL